MFYEWWLAAFPTIPPGTTTPYALPLPAVKHSKSGELAGSAVANPNLYYQPPPRAHDPYANIEEKSSPDEFIVDE